MIIDDKYFNLLHTLIHDKRDNMNGILSSLQITKGIGGYHISFRAYMNRINSERHIFQEDFEKGNVVFLLPFGIRYIEKEMENMAKSNTEAIKTFFGDKFRDDMIIKISEDERQEEIKKWDQFVKSLDNWDKVFDAKCEL